MNSGELRPRIVVVEDNPADVELLRLALRHAELDAELTVIPDGGQALEYFEGRGRTGELRPPDLAILDLNLPKNGGLEVLAALCRNPLFNDVAVTILSSSSWVRERPGLEGMRVHNFITKPSDLDEYLAIGHIVKATLATIRAAP